MNFNFRDKLFSYVRPYRRKHFLRIVIYQHAGVLETAKNDLPDDLSLMYLNM